MSTYIFHKHLRPLWEKAAALYQSGKRDPKTYFSAEEEYFLKLVGANSQDLYDFAEDFTGGGEPDWETFLTIQSIRLAYFRTVQKGEPSKIVFDGNSLPPFGSALEGIDWLPRIIPKARAKLRGELPTSLMYCCGGDRKFLKTHGFSAAEFLQTVWVFEKDDSEIVRWVKRFSLAK